MDLHQTDTELSAAVARAMGHEIEAWALRIPGAPECRVLVDDDGWRPWAPDTPGEDYHEVQEWLAARGYTITIRPFGEARCVLLKSRDGTETPGICSPSIAKSLCLAIVSLSAVEDDG